MLRGWFFVLLWGAATAFAEPCLEVTEKAMEVVPNEIGAAEVQWSASVVSHCDETRSVRAAVQFLDAEEEVAYEAHEQFDVRSGMTEEIGRGIYIPSRLSDRLKDIRLELKSSILPY